MEFLASIGFTILEKIFPFFLPKLKIHPKSLVFKKSSWIQKLNFDLINKTKNPLYDVYVLLDLGGISSKDLKFDFSKKENSKYEEMGNLKISLRVLVLDLILGGKDFILLKFFRINNEEVFCVDISCSEEAKIVASIEDYSKKASPILHGSDEEKFSTSFSIPKSLSKKGDIKMRGMRIVLAKKE